MIWRSKALNAALCQRPTIAAAETAQEKREDALIYPAV
jgi:hypothetical protein